MKKTKSTSQTQKSSKMKKGNSALEDKFAQFLRNRWELVLLVAYFAYLGWKIGFRLHWGFDWLHDEVLFMSSYRIWRGQVPFREFFPWYGPLYHYLLALFTGLMGNNLWAVKFYIDILNPAFCLGLLIILLRNLELPARARVFVVFSVLVMGLERIYHCGSLRSFLPVWVISLWYLGFRKKQKWIYFSIFPSCFLLFFFSPETGIFCFISGCLFVGLVWYFTDSKSDRFQILKWSSAGFLLTLLSFAVLLLTTEWFKNYLEFVSVVSRDLAWSYGWAKPGIRSLLKKPIDFYTYLPVLIYLGAIAVIGRRWWRKNFPKELSWVWILTLICYGGLFYISILLRGRSLQLQFAYLPLMLVASLVFLPIFTLSPSWRLALQILLVLLVIIGARFFHFKVFPEKPLKEFRNLLGVRISPEDYQLFEIIKNFSQSLKGYGKIAFPTNSFYYAFLNQTPDFALDNFYYAFYPNYRKRLLEQLEKDRPEYLIFYEKDFYWDMSPESLNAYYDYLDEHYQKIWAENLVHLYQRRAVSEPFSALVKMNPGPVTLTKENQFSFIPPIEERFSANYLEFNVEFIYRPSFLALFSLPIIIVRFDGKEWRFDRPEFGWQRISPSPGKHPYRIYLLYPFQELTIQFTFPGILNAKPSKVIIDDIKWQQFIRPYTARTPKYLLVEESKK